MLKYCEFGMSESQKGIKVRKILSVLLSVFMMQLLLTGCGEASQESEVLDTPNPKANRVEMIKASVDQIPVEKLVKRVVEFGCGRDPDALERLDQAVDESTLEYYLSSLYGIEKEALKEFAIVRAGGAEAFEIAVLRMNDSAKTNEAVEKLRDYILNREGDFTGYEPEQAKIVSNSIADITEYGDAALLICPNAAYAKSILDESYDWLFRWPFTVPGNDDMTIYDTSAILNAWRNGGKEDLSEKDEKILNRASEIVQNVVVDDMTEYEKERALYAWLTENVRYDQDHYDAIANMDPDSFNPYGALYNGKGICLAYATTFQLFMDMVNVECITVVGAAYESERDHAWNMVRLGGNWYCVDATWDEGDPEENWAYFNVTSDWMAGTDHQWDYSSVPEAIAEDGGQTSE